MIKDRLSPQNKKAMNLTVRETELSKLILLCMTAGEWDKARQMGSSQFIRTSYKMPKS